MMRRSKPDSERTGADSRAHELAELE